MKRKSNILLLSMCLVAAACGGQRNKDWDLDYSNVYRAYEGRENDSRYKAPTVIGCVDDDLYNCR